MSKKKNQGKAKVIKNFCRDKRKEEKPTKPSATFGGFERKKIF